MTEETTAPVHLPTGVFGDPAALRARMRESGSVHRVLLPDGMPAWLVTGYDEVRAALSDPRLVRDVRVAAPELAPHLGLAGDDFVLTRHVLFADPPDHTRMRRKLVAAFTRRRVAELAPWIRERTGELLDAVAGDGSADLVEALAMPLPIAVLAEMLGVPEADRARFHTVAEVLTGVNSSAGPDEILATGRWFDECLTDLLDRKRREPADDLISALLHDSGDTFSDIELRSNVFLLIAAGFETTANLIANGALALLTHPDAVAALREDPDLIGPAVEEVIRYDSPVSSITYRFAREPLVLGGVPIARGEHVALSPPSANHDPAEFADPHRFDVRRTPNRHVGFGYGAHFCLGASLARLEGEIALSAVLDRLDGVELAVPVSELTWRPTFVVHRLDRLPVRFRPTTTIRRPAAA